MPHLLLIFSADADQLASSGFYRLIWTYTICKVRVYLGSKEQWLKRLSQLQQMTKAGLQADSEDSDQPVHQPV